MPAFGPTPGMMPTAQPMAPVIPPLQQAQQQQPIMPDQKALQRQMMIAMMGSPDGGLPPEFTMPKPYQPPQPSQGRRGGTY